MNFSLINKDGVHPTIENNRSGYTAILISHFANLIPIVLVFLDGLPFSYLILLIIQIIVSIIYHAHHTNRIAQIVDLVFGCGVIIANIFILFSYNTGTMLHYKIFILIPVIALSIFLFLRKKDYALDHSFWHILAAVITTIVIW